jgi:hypothetical protein
MIASGWFLMRSFCLRSIATSGEWIIDCVICMAAVDISQRCNECVVCMLSPYCKQKFNHNKMILKVLVKCHLFGP